MKHTAEEYAEKLENLQDDDSEDSDDSEDPKEKTPEDNDPKNNFSERIARKKISL